MDGTYHLIGLAMRHNIGNMAGWDWCNMGYLDVDLPRETFLEPAVCLKILDMRPGVYSQPLTYCLLLVKVHHVSEKQEYIRVGCAEIFGDEEFGWFDGCDEHKIWLL